MSAAVTPWRRRAVLAALLIASLAGAVAVGLWLRLRGHGPESAQTAPAAAPVWTPVTRDTVSHGRFKNLAIFTPHAAARGLVLLLSGAEGWTSRMSDLAGQLAAQGALVVGIDGAQFSAELQADGANCEYPDGDLENLSHFIQAYYRLPTYLSPILAGTGAGGTLAYAALAQAPANTFAAGVSLGFCPTLALRKPLCRGSGVEFKDAGAAGVEFLPSKQITNPWVVTAAGDCGAADVRGFVAQVPGARLIDPPAIAAAIGDLLDRTAPAATAPDALKDLPIVEVAARAPPSAATPATGSVPSDLFAIMLSGDGGWAGIDKEVAAALSADGIPVVGLDSLRYFWSARTPQGLAADLDRIIDYYVHKLGKTHVLLVGYSQGADVLPFAVNRLSPQARAHVVLAAIMGMSEHALFEFHVSSWIADDDSGPATLPEVDRMSGMGVLCIYGEQETDSLCPRLDPRKITIVKVKGGHHFDGNYAALAQTLLASVHR